MRSWRCWFLVLLILYVKMSSLVNIIIHHISIFAVFSILKRILILHEAKLLEIKILLNVVINHSLQLNHFFEIRHFWAPIELVIHFIIFNVLFKLIIKVDVLDRTLLFRLFRLRWISMIKWVENIVHLNGRLRSLISLSLNSWLTESPLLGLDILTNLVSSLVSIGPFYDPILSKLCLLK